MGKYSDKFKLLYKNNNYKSKKQIFRKNVWNMILMKKRDY